MGEQGVLSGITFGHFTLLHAAGLTGRLSRLGVWEALEAFLGSPEAFLGSPEAFLGSPAA